MASILIIDGRSANREWLRALLGNGVPRLFQAADGAEGLDIAKAEHPDLIIADILVPTMDRCEFLHRLRADPPLASTHVIFTADLSYQEAASILEQPGPSWSAQSSVAELIELIASCAGNESFS